ncbi:MAG: 5-(carboxyamino)imidazole ribonucleotide synthase [Planctomycetota bacterium]
MSEVLAILGGGQLAQMLGAAASKLGVRCRALDPSPAACAARTCDLITGAFDDPVSLERLIDGASALTFEFENVPASALAEAHRAGVIVRPGVEALRVASDRLLEKQLFQASGMAVPAYLAVESTDDLRRALETIGCPLLLKARSGGYDGRSQARVDTPDDAELAWASIGRAPCLAEARVDLLGEVSVIACRSHTGEVALYPLAANEHHHGILVRSQSPAEVSEEISSTARAWTRAVLERLDYVGVLALELFVTPDGLLANECAPRVHNTGHSTIEGNQTSQFENHVRAVLGMELGSTDPIGHAVMRNLIGTVPKGLDRLRGPGVWAHDYGKAPRAGRKLGHITVIGESPAEVAKIEQAMLRSLEPEWASDTRTS